MKVKFEGWRRFRDSGDFHRWWTFEEDVEELSAAPGDRILDGGPTYDPEERFSVRRGKDDFLGTYSLEQVEEALGFDVGPWRPPREDHVRIAESLEKLTSAVGDLSALVRTRFDAEKTLDKVRELVEPKPKKETKQNRFLRLKGEHTYTSGDPFTDWELLVDLPELKVTRVQGADPMHAVKGDVLREEPGDELTPFELRRGGVRIGDPEWWQVRHLFVGLRDGDAEPSPGPSVQEDPGLALLDRLIPGGIWRHNFASNWSAGPALQAFQARRDIEGTPIRAWDIFVHWRNAKSITAKERAVVAGSIIPVPRSQLEALADAGEALRPLDGSWGLPEIPKFMGSLRRMANSKRGREDTTRIYILRPMVAPVSEPIRATNDDAAIFELLCQVGGRMPSKEA